MNIMAIADHRRNDHTKTVRVSTFKHSLRQNVAKIVKGGSLPHIVRMHAHTLVNHLKQRRASILRRGVDDKPPRLPHALQRILNVLTREPIVDRPPRAHDQRIGERIGKVFATAREAAELPTRLSRHINKVHFARPKKRLKRADERVLAFRRIEAMQRKQLATSQSLVAQRLHDELFKTSGLNAQLSKGPAIVSRKHILHDFVWQP